MPAWDYTWAALEDTVYAGQLLACSRQRFGVLLFMDRVAPRTWDQIRECGLGDRCAGVRQTGNSASVDGASVNNGPWGGFPALDPLDTIGGWFAEAGYRTGFVGKYLNGYHGDDGAHPGWHRWEALTRGVYDYLDFAISRGDDEVRYRDSYVTEVIEERTNRTVRELSATGEPFLLFSWHLAPHYRISPEGGRSLPPAEPQDETLFLDERPSAFDDPSFNEEDVSDKPPSIKSLSLLSSTQIAQIDTLHERRVESLQSVDELVEAVVGKLQNERVLDNTYVVFTSDNGATGQSSSSKASASWRQPCRAFSSEAERMTFRRVS